MVLAPPNEQLRRGEIDEREERSKRRGYNYNGLWSPYRPTIVYVGTVPIGLAIVEMSEEVLLRYVGGKYIRETDYMPPKVSRYDVDHTWTTTRAIPSGRLRLLAYSPYWRVSWSTEWQETKSAPIKALAAIVKAIEDSAASLVQKLEEADRLAEIARLERLAEEEKRRKEEDRRRVEQSVRDSREQLGHIIQKWATAMNVEQFLRGVEERTAELSDGKRHQVLQRLKLAREFLGTQDPLDFLLSWRTPSERYRPLYSSTDAVPKNGRTAESNS